MPECVSVPKPEDSPHIPAGLVPALTSAYASLLKRQRSASAAFVRWSTANSRSHEFVWFPPGTETLLLTGREITITSEHPAFIALNKMMATVQLNPYEKDLLYGYPYVVGHVHDTPIRAPLLTIPITIQADGGRLILKPNEESLRFNSLAFRSEHDSAAHEAALGRLIDATPAFPLTLAALNTFCQAVGREMGLRDIPQLDGALTTPPTQPRQAKPLMILPLAAAFIAPKTSYFLVKDLEDIAKESDEKVKETALGWLVGRRGKQPTSNEFTDTKTVYFPFSSNASQRRLALYTNDPTVHIALCVGPPGTGKSLTLSNLACHLVAKGERVLICSQKDKALQVVDELLRSLDMPELPMTLLRQDADSKRELRQRLEAINKSKPAAETEADNKRERQDFLRLAQDTMATEAELGHALHAEHLVAQADIALQRAQSFFRRVRTKWGLWEARRAAKRQAPQFSDHHGASATAKRTSLLAAAVNTLKATAIHRTGTATRDERNILREFSRILGRSQTNARNIPVFDRLKKEADRCHALLKILPCWIMTPDDVARLFPLEPGLFDWVLWDEASQGDIPSAVPVFYRAKKAVVVGDDRQMRARRLAFTNNQVANQAWRQHGLDRLDPDRIFDPTSTDLLQIASTHADESVLLNEHFRSLPGIISFSNGRWYGDQLRLMRDEADRRMGPPDRPYIELVHVSDGAVKPGTQENEREAQHLVDRLKILLEDPAYSEASMGVLGLFEEQVRLLSELIAEQIPEELRTEHDLIVSNPDGVQGDERDVILYSLSYDANGMEQAQLSARQAEQAHVQGMVNVMVTRAREQIVIFHSAPISQFGMANGQGVIKDWLEHCERVAKQSPPAAGAAMTYTQSEFEAEVLQALAAKGLETIPQFPACGFFIDIVATKDDQRLAIECDGEAWHLDEHGQLKQEDLIRQEILERAGWSVLRIPYRGWQRTPELYIERILKAFDAEEEEPSSSTDSEPPTTNGHKLQVSPYEAAILHALRQGVKDKDTVLKTARDHIGHTRLTASLRHTFENAIRVLVQRRLISLEEGELFETEGARGASIVTSVLPTLLRSRSYSRARHHRYRRH